MSLYDLKRWQVWTLAGIGFVLAVVIPAPWWVWAPLSFAMGFGVAAWERKYRRSL